MGKEAPKAGENAAAVHHHGVCLCIHCKRTAPDKGCHKRAVGDKEIAHRQADQHQNHSYCHTVHLGRSSTTPAGLPAMYKIRLMTGLRQCHRSAVPDKDTPGPFGGHYIVPVQHVQKQNKCQNTKPTTCMLRLTTGSSVRTSIPEWQEQDKQFLLSRRNSSQLL